MAFSRVLTYHGEVSNASFMSFSATVGAGRLAQDDKSPQRHKINGI